MQSKPTLKDLGKTPAQRRHASGSEQKVPTWLTVGPNSADLRAKNTARKLRIRTNRIRRPNGFIQKRRQRQLIFQPSPASKQLDVVARGIHRRNSVVVRILLSPPFSVLSRVISGRDCFRFRE
jgi:hypothetical protein